MAQVILEALSKTYSGAQRPALRGIDLHIKDGEFVVFVGPSGCGKSTLLRTIAGLENISGGNIRIDNHEVANLPPRQRNIAMVFQDYALYPHKTVFDNMAFGLKMRKLPEALIQEKVQSTADLLKISELLARKPRELSGGQRQRVAIGRAMVRNPDVFLFDEPLSNLDAQLRNVMRGEIKRLHQRLGKTMIYVTHDQVEAMTLADRIAVLKDGELIQYGTPAEIYSRPTTRFVAEFTGSPSMNFAEISLSEHDGQPVIRLGQHWLPIPQTRHERLRPLLGRKLLLGLRPENLRCGTQPEFSDEVVVESRVVLVEPLGAKVQLTLDISGQEFVTLLDAERYRPQIDESLKIILSLRHGHFFDPDSGVALDGTEVTDSQKENNMFFI